MKFVNKATDRLSITVQYENDSHKSVALSNRRGNIDGNKSKFGPYLSKLPSLLSMNVDAVKFILLLYVL